MGAKKLALIVGLGLLLLGGIALWSRMETSAQSVAENKVTTGVTNPDFVQIDYQNGAMVVATYQPTKSSATRAVVLIALSVDNSPIGSYDPAKEIVWADSNIDPLPTTATKVISSSERNLSVEMTFARTVGTHYHLLIKDFVGIRNRVVHFYL